MLASFLVRALWLRSTFTTSVPGTFGVAFKVQTSLLLARSGAKVSRNVAARLFVIVKLIIQLISGAVVACKRPINYVDGLSPLYVPSQ